MRALLPPRLLRAATKGAALSEAGRVAVLRPGPGRPLEHELAVWLDAKGPSPRVAVVAGGAEGEVPEPALVDLLGGPLGIGAVVPLLFDVHGSVAEAGTFVGPSGAVTAFNTGAALAAPEHSFRRDVAGSATPVVAVSADALDGFSPGSSRPSTRGSWLRCWTTCGPEVSGLCTNPPGEPRRPKVSRRYRLLEDRAGGRSETRPRRQGCW